MQQGEKTQDKTHTTNLGDQPFWDFQPYHPPQNELLFRVTPGSLILIDEPELSLHVVWQEQFLKDVQQITQ
jgi:hypothetical protein